MIPTAPEINSPEVEDKFILRPENEFFIYTLATSKVDHLNHHTLYLHGVF